MAKKKSSKWIQKAIKHKGALHRELGIKQDKNIPVSKINEKLSQLRAKSQKGKLTTSERKLLKRLVLAKTLRGLRHAK